MASIEQGAPEGIVTRVVGWLRAGYPMGVPEQDYVPLVGILRRSLTPAELEQVVGELLSESERADAAGEGLDPARLRERVEQLLLGPALPEDLVRVSVRLASAGWPLGDPEQVVEQPAQERAGLVTRVVRWLREGYPSGLPEQDFVPLVALLRRRLTDAEVTEVGSRLAADGDLPASRIDVSAAIARVTSELPSDEDVARVRRYLSEHGWPEDFAV
ncbi:Protein of unknown function [Rathayibacter oskolensis]|uniref:DUF3349 domain-containing protein n=1 Tax=Rathayibacter oskolensis TaxID=1891671 RepID=A0A1X7PB49_9MICO|nr:DUF3349 domain-containing protein [Rathayibacter oskolensis]SMH48473.1 Protein of unknown function [Rathayibacter oskolensis]